MMIAKRKTCSIGKAGFMTITISQISQVFSIEKTQFVSGLFLGFCYKNIECSWLIFVHFRASTAGSYIYYPRGAAYARLLICLVLCFVVFSVINEFSKASKKLILDLLVNVG